MIFLRNSFIKIVFLQTLKSFVSFRFVVQLDLRLCGEDPINRGAIIIRCVVNRKQIKETSEQKSHKQTYLEKKKIQGGGGDREKDREINRERDRQ